MEMSDPIETPKEKFDDIIQRISLKDSPVGIDAQYTHAIIITYLQQIDTRLKNVETAIANLQR
jgi:hypothetical protein